jgi:membrane associated rhomboid family serine protease
MIPLKDNLSTKRFPIVTLTLIVLNILIFMYELSLGPELLYFFRRYAVVPATFFDGGYYDIFGHKQSISPLEMVFPLVTSMFLHGGYIHIAGNMLYLWIFGDNIEDRLGSFRFLLLYIASGLVAATAHLIMNSESEVPSLGASGAVSGVLGAYILLYPKAKILTIFPILFFLQFFELPAFFFIGTWLIQQLLYGMVLFWVPGNESGGIAWWAHIGGFIAGFTFLMMLKPQKFRSYTNKKYLPLVERYLNQKEKEMESYNNTGPLSRHNALKVVDLTRVTSP